VTSLTQQNRITTDIIKSLNTLQQHYDHVDWKGRDPYDYIWRYGSIPIPVSSEALYYAFDGYFGFSLTDNAWFSKLLRIEPHHESKALAIFTRALSICPTLIKREATTRKLCDIIWELRNKETRHPSWGLSFPWRMNSGRILPPNSPTALITALSGMAFLSGYRLLNEEQYLKKAESAARYLTSEVGYTSYDDNSICIWYSPITKRNIINASAIASQFLNDLGHEIQDKDMLDMADRAYLLLMQEQTDFGGWFYDVGETDDHQLVDNYHNGFILESLLRYRGPLEKEVLVSAKRGVDFYTTMFRNDGSSIFNLVTHYPIDVHDMAQGVLVFSLANRFIGTDIQHALSIWQFAFNQLRREDGTFRSRIYGRGTSNASFPRWADSWMMLALAELLESL
jgi:hypothetical protein